MKKGGKIIFFILALAIVGVTTFIIVKGHNTKKQEISGNNATVNTSEKTSENTAQQATNTEIVENNSNQEKKNTGRVSANTKIAEALKSRKFLEENDIEEDSIKSIRFAKIAKGGNPVYLVVVNYGDSVEYGKTFAVYYADGNVKFDVIDEGKYLAEVFVDTSSSIVKTELTMRGATRNSFYGASNGALVKKDSFSKPASEEYANEIKYLYNQKEVTESQYKEKIDKYNKNNFKEFSQVSYDLNEENINKYVK